MIQYKLVDEISLNFPELFIIGKIGGDHAIFRVPEVKRSKILPKLIEKTVFVYIIGFLFHGVSRAKTDLRNKYMI